MPGPAGEVDKSEIRSMASKVAQYWPDRSQRSRRLAPAARISTITHRKAQPTNGYLIEALALSSYWRSRTSSTGRTRWSGSSSEAASEGMHAAPHLAPCGDGEGPGPTPVLGRRGCSSPSPLRPATWQRHSSLGNAL